MSQLNDEQPDKTAAGEEQVVVHFKDGTVLKGLLSNFDSAMLEQPVLRQEDICDPSESEQIQYSDLKAIYFVKDFSGNREYNEKKQFGLTSSKGKRVMVRFRDGEIVCGFVDGEILQKYGKSPENEKNAGFLLYPADPGGNNSKIFVITSSVVDIRRL